MTEVLSYHDDKADSQAYYQTSPLKRSSHSYSSFLSHSGSQYARSRPSPPSPTPSSTHIFSSNSYLDSSNRSNDPPTPASSIFSDEKEEEEDDITFSAYDDGVQFYHQDEPLDLSTSSSDDSDSDSINQDEPKTDDPTPAESPLLTPSVADDTAVRPNPSRHVDYLSHDWREEDIWASWRHIVSMRKQYGPKSRLENASWRTWAKSKYNLPTISPETLNWLKESDVTWLYGPLQPAQSHPITQTLSQPSPNHLASQTSFLAKKPILKKRSMSEVMLQRSLSANSLIKQAAASVQAQQKTTRTKSPHSHPAAQQLNAQNFAKEASRPISRDQLDYFSKVSSSGNTTPSDGPKRHIRFDEKVEQCIAVDCQNHYDDDDDDEHSNSSDSDSSDDGVLTIRRPRRQRRPTLGRRPHSTSQLSSTKIIEKLPDTTLKNKVEPPSSTTKPALHFPFSQNWISSKLNPSPSQETLRPANPTRNFLLSETNQSEESLAGLASRSVAEDDAIPGSGTHSPEERPLNMRRTPSGMFMPYNEDEEETAMQLGLFGRVSETINTAKDIAHVIWNVGWRK